MVGEIAPEYDWVPTEEVIERARLTAFMRLTGDESYGALHRRSISDIGAFTDQVIRFLGIRFETPYAQTLDLSRGVEWPRWCRGGRMNIVQSCLDHEGPAVIATDENGATTQLSYAELRSAVAEFAGTLGKHGLRAGDRVAIYMPMRADTVVALLACAWMGAVAVPLFSGYGPGAIASRLSQTEAAALVTTSHFQHGGKRINLAANVAEAIARCEHSLAVIEASDRTPGDVPLEVVDPENPLIIIFSSGTTGEPKGIIHSHCSFPIKAAQDMCFHMDVHSGDRISWITDLGWMMGPWLIYGALILGATVVLREGACDWPDTDALWAFCERNAINVLGVSPSLVRRLAELGDPAAHDLGALRFFASSGEPWDPASWQWLFRNVRKDSPVPIINYSGGTEIAGGILSNHPLAPIKACAFSAQCLGIAADLIGDASGPGELAIRAPWIGQARGFWNAPERYLETYWSQLPGVWVHGDWASRDTDGHWRILGRSDDTLKIAGKRVGPAEVESIVCSHPAVSEAAAIGVPHAQKGTALVVLCVAQKCGTLGEDLKRLVACELGKPLQPERICFVPALPKTRNGKTVRRLIRAAYLGDPLGDLGAIDNPETLEAIRDLDALKEA